MDMDSMPFPAWDLINIEAYKEYRGATPVGKRRFMSIFTSRACPYQCTYCHTIFGKKFRARSPENVVAEIRELRDRYGISVIEVSDDIFNLQWKRAHAISSAIASSDLNIRMSFPNGLRADIMRPELMKSMKAAGTYFISYAIESGSPRIQTLIKKHLQLDKTREVIAQTVDQGIYTNGFFMMGFPTETRSEVEQTIEFARSTRLHSASFFILVPFAGTEIHETSMNNLMPIASDQEFDYHSGIVNCSSMANHELLELKRKAYMQFYFGRGRIVRTVARHPEKRALGGLALSVLKRMELRDREALSPA
jgi:radical SAM superfamily enzyme YgiQ (UPF0313 family)